MNDSAHEARRDLAFMKAVADDKGPLPMLLGAHFVAIGLVFGLNFVLVWAIYARLIAWPAWLGWGTWLPGAIVYIPIHVVLQILGRRSTWGPTARALAAAWAPMGAVTLATVAVLVIATRTTGLPMYLPWPAMAFVLYGGAWFTGGIIRREGWHIAVAIACFAAAAGCAALIGTNAYWLAMAAGTMALVAVPGAAIMLRAPRA